MITLPVTGWSHSAVQVNVPLLNIDRRYNMPVYIAKNYEGTPLDVVFAVNEQLATAYWHGKGVTPHSTQTVSDANLQDHPTGVLPIVSTKVLLPFGGIGMTHMIPASKEVVIVKRNHS
jgi:hypothetical protein